MYHGMAIVFVLIPPCKTPPMPKEEEGSGATQLLIGALFPTHNT